MAAHKIWVSFGKSPQTVEFVDGDCVADLKMKVRTTFQPKLVHVPVDEIDIYLSRDAFEQRDDDNQQHKALKPGMLVSSIAGGRDDDTPLFVDYPDEPAAKRQRDEVLPKPVETSIKGFAPLVLEAGKLLDVTGFGDLVVAGTVADKPLFLRRHLMDVHDAAVRALKDEETRLVSLVGCPGVGKTWCGLLVAYTLEKTHEIRTLHVTVRGKLVVAIIGFSQKKTYEVLDFNFFMLKELIKEAGCKVCVLDVGVEDGQQARRIFEGARTTILEMPNCKVKIMGLLSGHGQETITGKQLTIAIQKLVMWSWTEEEVDELSAAMPADCAVPEAAFAVCGGSVRHLFNVKGDMEHIFEIVRNLDQAEMSRFLRLDVPTSDEGHKQRTRLMSFRPNDEHSDFRDGISAAALLPRSEFVIKCIKENQRADFQEVACMYRRLLPLNVGAAGTVFEQLVHIFWRDRIRDRAAVELQLIRILRTGADGEVQPLSIDCATFPSKLQSIEDWDVKEGELPLGYFTPKNPRYPVLDSILRFRTDEGVRALAFQVSIGETHKHSDHKHKLLSSVPKQLALWDYRAAGKLCQWKPLDSEHWHLCRVHCEDFDHQLDLAGLTRS